MGQAMGENPYQSPSADADLEIVGVRGGRREDLRSIAVYQKGLIACILIQLLTLPAQLAIPDDSLTMLLLSLGALVNGVVGLVFLIGLAVKTDLHPVVGVILGIVALFPCIGLLVLLAVSGRATKTLKDNGYRVGLLGASLSQFQ